MNKQRTWLHTTMIALFFSVAGAAGSWLYVTHDGADGNSPDNSADATADECAGDARTMYVITRRYRDHNGQVHFRRGLFIVPEDLDYHTTADDYLSAHINRLEESGSIVTDVERVD